MIADRGQAGDSGRFLFPGQHETLPTSRAVIV